MADNKETIVLVTGGSGMVGQAMKQVIEEEKPLNEKWIFLSSKDADLRDFGETKAIMEKHKPTHVIHLASLTGGLFKQLNFSCDLFRFNHLINENVLEISKILKVKKLVSCLSTSIYPAETSYPIDETMIYNGMPHHSHLGYSYAKRMIDVMNIVYNKQYGCNFLSVIPTNIYGPYANFNLDDGHVISGLIHKMYLAKKNGTPFTIFGTGNALRQFIYSKDIAKLMIWVLRSYNEISPMILSSNEEDEVAIKDVAQLVVDAFDFKGDVVYDTSKPDGQLSRTASNAKMRKYLPDFEFTPLSQGIKETVEWFNANYDTARK